MYKGKKVVGILILFLLLLLNIAQMLYLNHKLKNNKIEKVVQKFSNTLISPVKLYFLVNNSLPEKYSDLLPYIHEDISIELFDEMTAYGFIYPEEGNIEKNELCILAMRESIYTARFLLSDWQVYRVRILKSFDTNISDAEFLNNFKRPNFDNFVFHKKITGIFLSNNIDIADYHNLCLLQAKVAVGKDEVKYKEELNSLINKIISQLKSH